MGRFLSCFVFLAVLLSVCMLPIVDKPLDLEFPREAANAESSESADSSDAFESTEISVDLNSPEDVEETETFGESAEKDVDEAVIVLATPTPTPAPTPSPTPTPPPIVKGDSGDDVTQMQLNLIALGFMTTSPDGVYGKNTEKAVEAAKGYLNRADTDQNGLYLTEEEAAELSLLDQYSEENGDEADDAEGGSDAEAATSGDDTASDDETSATEEASMDGETGLEDGTDADDVEPSVRPTRPPKYGTEGDNVSYALLTVLADEENFPLLTLTVERGTTGEDALRVQRRLNTLEYIFRGIDGKIGNLTVEAIANFQRVNGLTQTGIADIQTLRKMFSSDAYENDQPIHPYKIFVSKKQQRVYVYQWNDASGDYDIQYKSFICSTGKKTKESDTPTGTYSIDTGPANRWHYFKEFNCWAQYAYSIQGNVLFHSVLFKKDDEKTMIKSSYNNLGKAVSHGCVRLKVEDAKWIWDNCPAGTNVIIE